MFVSHVCAGCFCGDAGLPHFPSLSRSLDLRDLPLAARQRFRKQVSLSSGSVIHLGGVSKVNGRNQMVECKRADEGGSMPHWNDVRVVDVARGLPPTTCRTAFISSRCLQNSGSFQELRTVRGRTVRQRAHLDYAWYLPCAVPGPSTSASRRTFRRHCAQGCRTSLFCWIMDLKLKPLQIEG